MVNLNLITNASDAIGDNNGEIKLTTGVLEPIRHPNNSLGDNRIFDGDHCIFIEVSDTGVGMAEEVVGKIFEPFYRLDKARMRKNGGFGLGLAIAQKQTERLGGKLSAKNIPAGGLMMVVELPAD